MSFTATLENPDKPRIVASWVLRIALAVAFLGAAGAKLVGLPMMVEIFDQIGVGQWFRYATAIVEIVGVIALFVPGMIVLGAAGLDATMVGAIIVHLFILHSSPVPAVVLLVLAVVTAWLHGAEIATLRSRLA